jgi:hypothetical protein
MEGVCGADKSQQATFQRRLFDLGVRRGIIENIIP